MSGSDRMDPHDERILERDDAWRPRPRRLLIGLALVAIAIVWSIVNATASGCAGRYGSSRLPCPRTYVWPDSSNVRISAALISAWYDWPSPERVGTGP